MKRYLFENMDKKPPLTVSLNAPTPDETISVIRNAVYGGADGFLIHLENMQNEYVNKETLETIYSYAEDKPIMTLNYRSSRNAGKTDEELIKDQLMSLDAGASCVDIMGDFFDPVEDQLTTNTEAIKKQIEYIDKVHSMGAQVLMSAHTKYKNTQELIHYVNTMKERGADIAKVAMMALTEEEANQAFISTMELKKVSDIPFLLIAGGKYGKAQRALAPVFGSCMVLCVEKYAPGFHREKVLLSAAKAIYDNLDYKPYR